MDKLVANRVDLYEGHRSQGSTRQFSFMNPAYGEMQEDAGKPLLIHTGGSACSAMHCNAMDVFTNEVQSKSRRPTSGVIVLPWLCTASIQRKKIQPIHSNHHSFAIGRDFISRALSLSTRLSSLPLGFFGTTSMNSTPPASFLYATLLSATCYTDRITMCQLPFCARIGGRREWRTDLHD